MGNALRFAVISSVFVLGACVADPPEITSSGESADAGASSDGGAVDPSGDSGIGGATHDGGFGGEDAGEPTGDSLSASCAEIDGGGVACSGGTPVCCAVQDPGGGFNSVSFDCAASSASCAALTVGVAIACRQPSDCASGSVCCGRKSSTNNSIFVSVKCETSCDGVASFDHAVYCDPGDPHTCDGTNGGTTPYCEASDFPGMFDCEHD